MKTLTLLLLAVAVSGCTPMPPKVPDPVIVTVKEEVNIDPILLADCDFPAFMPTTMNQVESLKFSQGEAVKLILCRKKHRSLADAISKAFNVNPPELTPKSPANGQK